MGWKNRVVIIQITNITGLILKVKDQGLKLYEDCPWLQSEEVCPYVFFTNMITGIVLDFYSVSFFNFRSPVHGRSFPLYSPPLMILAFHLLIT